MRKALIIVSTLSAILAGCTSEDIISSEEMTNNKDRSISVVVEDLVSRNTRTSYTPTDYGYRFAWTEGDAIGIFPLNGHQTDFPISNGYGTNTAVFDGGDWALKPNSTYAAYYPLNDKLSLDKTAIPVDYIGQVQVGDGSTDHIGAYDYMFSAFTKVDEKGNVNFKMQHLGCLVKFNLTMPDADSYRSFVIESDNKQFVTSGKYSLSDDSHKLYDIVKSNSITIGLSNVSTTTQNKTLTITAMVAPVDLSGSKLTIKVVGEKDEYLFEVDGEDLTKGNAINSKIDPIDTTPYITFEAESVQTLTMSSEVDKLEYSLNGGEWAALGTETITFGGANGNLRLRGSNGYGSAIDNESTASVIFGNDTPVECYGDIRTLADYKNYDTEDTKDDCFAHLFYECSNLTSAPDLPATSLAESCYCKMFYGCTSLNDVQEKLPAMILTNRCYSGMFDGCESLVTAPKLPATTLAEYCYENMFKNCISLKNLPELKAKIMAPWCYAAMFYGTSLVEAPVIEATTLAENCFRCMFKFCTNIKTASALPVTTLANECYFEMYRGCPNLTAAPKLPAETLTEGCYYQMFMACSNLSHIEMLATDVSATSCMTNWVKDVAATGTFVKNNNATLDIRGVNGVPEGWIIKNESGEIFFASDFSLIYKAGETSNPDSKKTIKFIAQAGQTLTFDYEASLAYMKYYEDSSFPPVTYDTQLIVTATRTGSTEKIFTKKPATSSVTKFTGNFSYVFTETGEYSIEFAVIGSSKTGGNANITNLQVK